MSIHTRGQAAAQLLLLCKGWRKLMLWRRLFYAFIARGCSSSSSLFIRLWPRQHEANYLFFLSILPGRHKQLPLRGMGRKRALNLTTWGWLESFCVSYITIELSSKRHRWLKSLGAALVIKWTNSKNKTTNHVCPTYSNSRGLSRDKKGCNCHCLNNRISSKPFIRARTCYRRLFAVLWKNHTSLKEGKGNDTKFAYLSVLIVVW